MVSGRIYKVIESDVPNLYHVGLYTLIGRKKHIDTKDYYRLITEEDTKKRLHPHHRDNNTGLLYEYVRPSEVDRYRYQFNDIKDEIEEAEKGNIKPITHEDIKIEQHMSDIVNDLEKEKLSDKFKHETNAEIRKQRLKHTGEVFKQGFDLLTEPQRKAMGLVGNGVEQFTDNVASLAGSPIFLIGAIGVGIIALKVIL